MAYDAPNPKRLREVPRCREDYGCRRQLSVFLRQLSATDFAKLRLRQYDLIDPAADQVWFVPLCGRCVEKIAALGRPADPPDANDAVIVVWPAPVWRGSLCLVHPRGFAISIEPARRKYVRARRRSRRRRNDSPEAASPPASRC